MSYEQEKELWVFFSHLFLCCYYEHAEIEILNLTSSWRCAVCYAHSSILALLKNPFTKTEQIINPHFMYGKSPKQRWPASHGNSLVFSPLPMPSSHMYSCKWRGNEHPWGLPSKVCLVWPEAPSVFLISGMPFLPLFPSHYVFRFHAAFTLNWIRDV